MQYIYDNLTVPTGIEDIDAPEWNDNVEANNGIIVSVKSGMLCVESTVETTLDIYRTDGTLAGEINVNVGENLYPLAPRGVIIVNGQRIYLKPVR